MNKGKIKQDFIKWVKEKHGEDLNGANIYVDEVDINGSNGVTVMMVELHEDGGKSFFKVVEDGFEYEGHKDW